MATQMEAGVRLRVGAAGIENLTALGKGLSDAGVETSGFEKKAAELSAELQRLGQQQALIDQFRRQKQAVDDAAVALATAKTRAGELGREMSALEAPTKAQQTAFDRARQAARDADAAYEAERLALQRLREPMAAAGVAADDLAAAQVRVHRGLAEVQAQTQEAARWAQQVTQAQGEFARSTASSERKTLELALALKGLQAELKQSGGAGESFVQRLDSALRTTGIRGVKAVEAEIEQLRSALATVHAADPFGPDAQRAAAAVEQRVHALNVELGRVPAEAQQAGAGMAQVSARSAAMGDSVGVATAKATQLALALATAFGGGQLARSALETGASFETLRVRLEQVLGGAAAAEQAFTKIKALATSTPFEVKDLTEAYIKLTSFGLKPTEQQLTALADTAAVAGGGTEALQRVVLALGQAWAKTKLQGDEILQLTEAGVPVWDLLAKATGKNVVELQKLSESGALGRDVILKLFDALGEKNAGASARLMATFSGAVSNAKDALHEFFDMVARSGALDYLTGKLNEALDEFQRLKDTGELERKAKAVADAFLSFAHGVESVVRAIPQLVAVLEPLLALLVAKKVIDWADALVVWSTRQRALTLELGYAAVAQQRMAVTAAEAAVAQRGMGAAVGAGAAAMTGAGAAAGAAAVATERAALGAGLLARAFGALRLLSVVGLVTGVAELAAEFFRAKRAAEEGDAAFRRMMAEPPPNKAKAAVHDVLAELEDFAKKLPGLENQIAGLTGEGLANAAKGTLENLRAIHADATTAQKAMLTLSERAAQALGIELPSQSAKASDAFKGVRAEVETLVGQLPNLGLKVQQSAAIIGQAFNKLIDAAKTEADFKAVNKAIADMERAGRLGPGAAAELLQKAADKARELREEVEKNTPGMQSLGEAARAAGVDVERLTGGLTKDGRQAADQVRDLVEQVVKAGVAAERSSPVLAEAIDKRIPAARTVEELRALEIQLLRARDAGKIFGADFDGALNLVKGKLLELSPALRQVQQDAATLGLQLKDKIGRGMEAGAEAGIRAYERLKASGRASERELTQAFVNVANEAIKAANGQVPEWVKVEAALRGVAVETDASGNAFVRMAKQAADAAQSVIAGFNDAAQAARNAKVAARDANYDKDGFRLDSNGQRMTAGVQLDPPDSSGNWEFDQAGYTKAVNNMRSTGQHGFSRIDDEIRMRAFARQFWKPKAGAQDSAASGGGSSSGASTTHVVTVNLNGVSRTINTASAGDSQALAALLKALETSASVAQVGG